MQAAATEHASEELFGMLPSTDALAQGEGGEGGESGESGEGGGGSVKGSERGTAASEAGSEVSKGRRRRKKSVWGDALQQTAQSKPTALGDMWSVTGGIVVGAVVQGAVVGVDGVRGAGEARILGDCRSSDPSLRAAESRPTRSAATATAPPRCAAAHAPLLAPLSEASSLSPLTMCTGTTASTRPAGSRASGAPLLLRDAPR